MARLAQAAIEAPPAVAAPVHRLSRTEYANAVRDLLALDISVEDLLPADPSVQGFDNNADALSFTPALLERYVVAAHKISKTVVEGADPDRDVTIYEVPKGLRQEGRMSDDLPLGSRGRPGGPTVLPRLRRLRGACAVSGRGGAEPLLAVLDGRNVAARRP